MSYAHKKQRLLPKKRPVTLSLRRDLLEEAKALKLNASRAAENGLIIAIREAQERAWLEENKEAIADYNEMIRKEGMFYTPPWAEPDDKI